MESLFQEILGRIPKRTETLAEIGIGFGAFTHKILGLGYPVTLFEIDPHLVHLFRTGIGASYENWDLLEGDCLQNLHLLSGRFPFVFGNLPYSITSEILTETLKNVPDLTGFLFLVQKEFAERVTQEVSSIALFARAFGRIEKFRSVRRTCFYPKPRVDSEFLFFEPYPNGPIPDLAQWEVLLRVIFWGKRKKFSTSIREAPESLFLGAKVPPFFRLQLLELIYSLQWENKRPEEVQFSEWDVILLRMKKV